MEKQKNNLSILKKHISQKTIAPFYIFYGDEYFLKDYYLKTIEKLLLPEGLEEFNLEKLEGKGLAFNTLRDAVESVPLMCEQRLVIVKDFDLFKAGAEMKKQLEDFFQKLPVSCCLIFLYSFLEYKPDGRQKLAAIINKNALAVEFPIQANHQLVPWITRNFSVLKKGIDPRDAEYMIFRCGGLMAPLKSEISKVAAYCSKSVVSREDIDSVIIPVLDARTFDLSDAVTGGDIRKAAHILQDLRLMREEPLMILGAVGRQIRGLYVARLALERQMDAKTVMEILGYRSLYPAKLLIDMARRRTLPWCRKAVELCAETDLWLKSLSRDRERILELFLAELWDIAV